MDGSVQFIIAAVASFFFVAVIILFLIFLCKFTRQPGRSRIRTRSTPEPAQLSSIATGESATFDPSVSPISMEELKVATKNFSADLIIGDGSFGLVYKATLSNGTTVAIKKLDQDAFQGLREFQAEMETLGKLRHPNIVRILGYCVSGRDRVLIYEFLERGSLDQWIHDTEDENKGARWPLSWQTRSRVMWGVANGLSYLHGLDNPIIHRDIKASNVLLDMDYEAHIADFGLARWMDSSHSHVSTQVAGTMGYMPPEYKEGLTGATVKADVYSFGVLMIETVAGSRPNWPMVVNGKEMRLVEWSRQMLEDKREFEMVDSNIKREELNEMKVKQYFEIACKCTSDVSRLRPVMSEVVYLLNQIQT